LVNPLKIGLLTRNRDAWPSTQLRRALVQHSVQPVCFTFSDITANLGSIPAISIQEDIDALKELNALIVRPIGRGSLDEIIFRLDFLHRLERGGLFIVNPPSSIEKSVDKYYALSLLSENGIRVPRTIITENPDSALLAFDKLGRDVVIKPLFGSQGFGITRVSDKEVARRIFNTLNYTRNVLYAQEFIHHGKLDIRCLIVGGKVVAAMKRRARGWKTNVSQGAKPISIELSEELKEIAIKSTEILGCRVAGVDILEGPDDYFVNEVNSQPGFRGLQIVSKVDVAEEIVRYILNELKR
jgi:ribosomal protein S6--L-glutamate ligase/tetrahydromethanopterin:alpha-L-glutamate ligase|tara:strand:+ start:135 stop:1028 length:894 start_codon:yes stop_codon:yes gene_type:complete